MPHVVVGTWSFSECAVEAGYKTLLSNKTCVDALELGINKIEDNPEYGQCIVGKGGLRNAVGHLEMDAAIMSGKPFNFGSVTALQGVPRAVSVARAVMERSTHSMLTGTGALTFAQNNGFQVDESLLSTKQTMATEEESTAMKPSGHDTLGLIAVEAHKQIATAVSTSGMPKKHPGRVGDSALPGCGLYADEHGAACCSGDGDEIMKYCPSFHVVQLIKQGMTPQSACEEVVCSISDRTKENPIELAVIAADIQGNYGSATTVSQWTDPITKKVYSGFPYVVQKNGMTSPEIVVAPPVSGIR